MKKRFARTVLIAVEAWLLEEENLETLVPNALRAYADHVEQNGGSIVDELRISPVLTVMSVHLGGLKPPQ